MSDGKITVDLKQREVEVLAAYVASLKSKPDVRYPPVNPLPEANVNIL